VFVSPFLILFLVFKAYPVLLGLYTSFMHVTSLEVGGFVGFDNYTAIFKEKDFYLALRNTLMFTALSIITQLPVALILALVLNRLRIKWLRTYLRTAFFVPIIVSGVIAGVMFGLLFHPELGQVNWLLSRLGLIREVVFWTSNSRLMLPTLIMVCFWKFVGYHMVLYLAGLQQIDPALIEVAELDGASWFRKLFSVILPQLKNIFAFTAIIATVGSLQVFEIPVSLLQASGALHANTEGTNKAYLFLFSYIYRRGIREGLLGWAIAASWVVFLLAIGATVLQLKLYRTDES
jgi:ABC-type sugar transport system permease subunit